MSKKIKHTMFFSDCDVTLAVDPSVDDGLLASNPPKKCCDVDKTMPN